MLKPVTVPPEILNLKDTKLPEKLLLALYAADPATRRLRRALSMTAAGLRKLERRLIGKRLLAVAGAHHMVSVPGLAYIGHHDGGHFVSDSSTTKTEEKVAPHKSKPTQAETRPLLVSAELLNFRYLMAAEKLLLACYAANPVASNDEVLETLGISLAGLKKLKRRLIEKQVLVPTDDGYTIRLPGFVLVRGHFIPEIEAVKNGYKVALPVPKLAPAKGVYKYWVSSLKTMSRNPSTTASECLSFTTKMIERIEVESPQGPEREAALSLMKQAENVFFARDFVFDNIPRKYEAKCLQFVGSATPEQLVSFREKAEGMMLAGIPDPKLLGMLSSTIAPPPQGEIQPTQIRKLIRSV